MRITSALAGAGFVLLAAGTGLFTLLIAGFTCDETCEGERPGPGDHWPDYSDAWQWELVAGLGLAALVVTLAWVVAAIMGRTGLARVLALTYGAASVALAVLLDQAGDSFALIAAPGAVACALLSSAAQERARLSA